MRLICLYYRRAMTRRLVRGESITPDGALDRHLRDCRDCARVRGDYLRLETLLPSTYPEPRLSTDFDANLEARLRAVDRSRAVPAGGWSMIAIRGTAVVGLAAAALCLIGLGQLWRGAKDGRRDGEAAIGRPIHK